MVDGSVLVSPFGLGWSFLTQPGAHPGDDWARRIANALAHAAQVLRRAGTLGPGAAVASPSPVLQAGWYAAVLDEAPVRLAHAATDGTAERWENDQRVARVRTVGAAASRSAWYRRLDLPHAGGVPSGATAPAPPLPPAAAALLAGWAADAPRRPERGPAVRALRRAFGSTPLALVDGIHASGEPWARVTQDGGRWHVVPYGDHPHAPFLVDAVQRGLDGET